MSEVKHTPTPGLSKRELLAGLAMIGFIANGSKKEDADLNQLRKDIAAESYALADAMLEEGKKCSS